jgi:hypothetical protein
MKANELYEHYTKFQSGPILYLEPACSFIVFESSGFRCSGVAKHKPRQPLFLRLIPNVISVLDTPGFFLFLNSEGSPLFFSPGTFARFHPIVLFFMQSAIFHPIPGILR